MTTATWDIFAMIAKWKSMTFTIEKSNQYQIYGVEIFGWFMTLNNHRTGVDYSMLYEQIGCWAAQLSYTLKIEEIDIKHWQSVMSLSKLVFILIDNFWYSEFHIDIDDAKCHFYIV